MFRNWVRYDTIKEISYSLNFTIWNTTFFSFFPLASTSVAPFVDKNYNSQEDLYDAILNTFFPIFFVILLNASRKSGSIKNIVLPLLDDVLYNTITWVAPLMVSFAYEGLMDIRIFSIIDMILHLSCAIFAIIKWKHVKESDNILNITIIFLISFPAFVIPIFWIIIITSRHVLDSIYIAFLILFGICLIALMLAFIPCCKKKLLYEICIICFYVPNILQTLLIALIWPINFYFIKAIAFVLILSLTRNVSYFAADEEPANFLATSTTLTQCYIRNQKTKT